MLTTHTFTHNARVLCALIMRDVRVLRKRLLNLAIDASITVLMAVLVFGNLFPILGMPLHCIAPIFIGHSVLILLASLGYGYALRMVHDIKSYRFIDYLLTLPIPKQWLFFYFIVSFIIEAALITVPLITIGIVLLGNTFGTINGSFFIFSSFFVLVLAFWSTFFTCASFIYSQEWFNNNMWSRRVMPLFTCGPAFFSLSDVAKVSPLLSRLMLLNPVTYLAEGLRSALLNDTQYLAWYYCCTALLLFIGLLALRLSYGVAQQLDPV